jgi:hypothetical protein
MTEPSTQANSTNPSTQPGQTPGQARPGGSSAFSTDAEKKAQADKAKTAGSLSANQEKPEDSYSSKS